MRDIDELNLVQALIARVSFFRPAAIPKKKMNPRAVPRITEFRASSQTADDATNRGQITFSWSTQDTNYVELSYQCAPPGPGTVILEDGGVAQECENATARSESPMIHYRGPIGSQPAGFGNFHRIDSISITVKLMPFSYGRAYPNSSKSITVQVDPYNPFPEGVPAADGKIVLSYPVSTDGTTTLQQGCP